MRGPAARRPSVAGVLLLFLSSVVGSVLFVVSYTLEASAQLLGLTAGVALGSLGIGLGVWSKRLMPQEPSEEERRTLESPAGEERETATTFRRGFRSVGRRRLLGGMLGTALGGMGLAAAWTVRSLGPPPGITLRQTGWSSGVRVVDVDENPVHVDDLQVGAVITVFPEGRSREADDQVVLVRVDSPSIRPQPGREDWAPEGHLAYSRICTHAGCPVGLFQPNAHLLLCPCHQATFDIVEGGRTVFGPAPRPLPQLPLATDDEGYLIARSDFPEPVGPDRWRLG